MSGRAAISLGMRCDVAWQLRAHGAQAEPHVFDLLASAVSGVIRVLDRDFDVFHPEHLQWHAGDPPRIVDRITGIGVDAHFARPGEPAPRHFLDAYGAFRAAFLVLARRFRATVHAGPVTLIRYHVTAPEAAALEAAFFRRFPRADARFLYLVTAGPLFETEVGRAVLLPRRVRAVGAAADWIGVLRAQGLIKAPYRACTEEIAGPMTDDADASTDRRFEEAELLQAQVANPGHAGFHAELSLFYATRGKLPAALHAMGQAVACAPEVVRWQRERALLQWRLGRITGEQAMIALELEPPSLRGHFARETVRLLMACHDWEEARELCLVLTMHHPGDAELFFLKGRICLASGRPREAELAADRAIVLRPGLWAYHMLQAAIYLRQERTEEALTAAQVALGLEDNPETRTMVEAVRVRRGTAAE